jgi:tRNA1(Val) A37 N6-methylase TrmN6
MNIIEIKNKFDILLKQLSTERSFDVAEKITAELVGLLNIKVAEKFLVNIPRVDAELTRFQLAPGFARQAAAYELPHEGGKPLDFKLFWIKKASKTNLSWLVGLAPNFEDAPSNDYKNIGIDFVVPEACDSIIVLLSNRFKIRALELKDHITPTQLEIFAQWAKMSELEIADQNELKNNLHAKLWESFNFEPINRKFYLELVEHFSILVHHLEKDLGRKPSVMFTTRLIGRLLFIWFLKKKNLVNTNVDYFFVPDPEKQAEYYKAHLEKLFFEVLNKDELGRTNGDKLTPYLNGGLFDKSTTDFYGDSKLTFPNGYFNQLFSTLNKYNFTVDESSPEFQHVAIDPEMLGRIFESLLAEQIDENTGNSKKKATGAFYTPREIVSYMCEQSLIEYLKTKVSDALDRDRRIEELVRMPEAIFRDQDQNKRRDWKPYREAIIKALEGSKTESPLTILDPAVGSGAFPMGMLHLLVKVYSRLDPKFEKDISGLKRDILSRSLYGVDIEQTAIEITRLRAWLSIIVDIPEDKKVEPLPNLEFKFVCANTLIPLDDTEQATFFTDHDLKDKLITIRDEYFKTSSKAKKEKLQKDYLKLTQNVSLFDNKKTQQLKSYKPFDISSSSEFYDPELMHGVQAFNVVIGNPPYVSVKKITVQNKKKFTKLFETGKGRFNLFTLFLEKGQKLIKKKGLLTFILPEGLFSNHEYRHIRSYLVSKTTILSICLFSKRVFEAAVDTAIISFKNTKENRLLSISKDLIETGVYLKQSELDFSPNYLFPVMVGGDNKSIITKLNKCPNKFVDYLEVQQGIIYSGKPKSEVFANEKVSDQYKKILDGRDITKYQLNWDIKKENRYIKYSKDLHRSREERIFLADPKIVLPRRSTKLICTIDDEQYYLLNTAYIILPLKNDVDLYYILGILNSRLIDFYYQNLFFGWQITIPSLNSLPIILGDSYQQNDIIKIVKRISILKKQNKDADIKNLESQIDQLVYKLYDLTPEERKIVEESMK